MLYRQQLAKSNFLKGQTDEKFNFYGWIYVYSLGILFRNLKYIIMMKKYGIFRIQVAALVSLIYTVQLTRCECSLQDASAIMKMRNCV